MKEHNKNHFWNLTSFRIECYFHFIFFTLLLLVFFNSPVITMSLHDLEFLLLFYKYSKITMKRWKLWTRCGTYISDVLSSDCSLKGHELLSLPFCDSRPATPSDTSMESMSTCGSYKAKLALLDLFSGCGGMSTGLCLGAKVSCVDLVTVCFWNFVMLLEVKKFSCLSTHMIVALFPFYFRDGH